MKIFKKQERIIWSNIHLTKVSKEKDVRNREEKILKEIMAENFPKTVKDVNLQIQKL